MPVAGTWETPSTVQAPQRFRTVSAEPQPQQQAEQPQRSCHTVGLPPVKPIKHKLALDRRECVPTSGSPSNQTAKASPRPTSDSRKHSTLDPHHIDVCKSKKNKTVCGDSRLQVLTPTTQKAPRTLNVMELVNQAAQREEQAEADLARRRAALLVTGSGTTKLHVVPPGASSSKCSSAKMPSSPVSVRASGPLVPFQTASLNTSAAARTPVPRALPNVAGQAASGIHVSNQTKVDVSPQSPDVNKLQQHQQQQQQMNLSHVLSLSSECGSDVCTAAPPSLSSSASSSSLCSAASLLSNASTTSSGRPKSILLNRTSTGSSCSSGSSPRYSKRVTWKDGQADEESVGRGLVAVVMLEDDPELRQLRKNTWPERPGARRDALEAKAAAEAAATAAVAAKQQQQQQQQTGLVGKLLQEPTKLLDWRDKLKQLQAERRQQHMAQVQAAWEVQEHKLTGQDGNSSSQQPQQESKATTPLGSMCSKASVLPCSSVTINVISVATGVEAAV